MERRGKPSRSGLTLVPAVEIEPPKAPEHLPEAAKEVWDEVFGAVRPEQLRGAEFLVESYANTVALEREAARLLETLPPGRARDSLARTRRQEANLAMALARSLRLTPQIAF